MLERLISVGLDVGTTTTQLVVSELTAQNRASSFSVPEMEISQRKILYESPVHFTPLRGVDLVDGEAIGAMVAEEYEKAGITRTQVDTGAVIITGETSRKENARAVLQALSDFAGDFVVTTAGPDLESVLAAKGAGATEFSEKTGKTVLHMDIGGGTSNLALIREGQIAATSCLNVGGRLLKFGEDGSLCYISPVLDGIFDGSLGEKPSLAELEKLAETLVSALEMAAGLREVTPLLDKLWTTEAGGNMSLRTSPQTGVAISLPFRNPLGIATSPSAPRNDSKIVISFSGGVADCIEKEYPPFAFGDMGPILGRAIRRSRLCAGEYRLGEETIRATVIGAGSHSAQLSGSTVFYRGIGFPLKNLPVVWEISQLKGLDSPGVLALQGTPAARYCQIAELAEKIVRDWPDGPVLIALEEDMAKALGHALVLRLPEERPILCIDRVKFPAQSYLDVGKPVGTALPVVIKTLIFNR